VASLLPSPPPQAPPAALAGSDTMGARANVNTRTSMYAIARFIVFLIL